MRQEKMEWTARFTDRGLCAVSRAALGIAVLACMAHGQLGVDPEGPVPGGQWSGPFNTAGVMEPYAEIAHAAVLPPPLNDPTLTSDERLETPRVLFWCRSNCDLPKQSHVYVWYPNRPTARLQSVVLTSSPSDGSRDIFCSHHVLAPNGDLLIAGGVNYAVKCDGTTWPCLINPAAPARPT